MTVREENRSLLDFLRDVRLMTEHQTRVLWEGAEHPGHCTCNLCREWWRLVGPDEDTGMYGPFGATIDD